MITVTDPDALTPISYRTDAELEEFAIFCVCVAGKRARVVRRCLTEFWRAQVLRYGHGTPFELIRCMHQGYLWRELRLFGIGCYKAKAAAIEGLARSGLDLRRITTAQLELIPGIGPKTSRFFVMYTQPGTRVAVLDTHILRWMREEHAIDTPTATPAGRRYHELEEKFLGLVPAGESVAEFDLQIWKRYRK